MSILHNIKCVFKNKTLFEQHFEIPNKDGIFEILLDETVVFKSKNTEKMIGQSNKKNDSSENNSSEDNSSAAQYYYEMHKPGTIDYNGIDWANPPDWARGGGDEHKNRTRKTSKKGGKRKNKSQKNK